MIYSVLNCTEVHHARHQLEFICSMINNNQPFQILTLKCSMSWKINLWVEFFFMLIWGQNIKNANVHFHHFPINCTQETHFLKVCEISLPYITSWWVQMAYNRCWLSCFKKKLFPGFQQLFSDFFAFYLCRLLTQNQLLVVHEDVFSLQCMFNIFNVINIILLVGWQLTNSCSFIWRGPMSSDIYVVSVPNQIQPPKRLFVSDYYSTKLKH